MTNSELLIAHRFASEMEKLIKSGEHIAKDAGFNSAPHRECMNFFMGFGLALGIVFEELTGRSAKNVKPQEILEWVKNLPQPQKRDPLRVN